jgi:hypothetical protein
VGGGLRLSSVSSARTAGSGSRCTDFYYGCYYGNFRLSDLAILSVETGEEQLLTNTPVQPEWSAVWARDAQRVFYIAAEAGNQDVFAVPAAGGTPIFEVIGGR